jgi:hypothetical protein
VPHPQTIIELPGTYGGRTSRDVILRGLKEALALVENTPPDAELTCSGLRIEVVAAGTPRKER